MNEKYIPQVDYNLPYDSKVQRLKRRYQGLSRVAASINDLYIMEFIQTTILI